MARPTRNSADGGASGAAGMARAVTAEAGVAEVVPLSGLMAGTQVLTLDGEIPVEFLSPGDRIVTRSGVRALRRIVSRRLDRLRIVTVRAGSLGHDRPGRDLAVAAGQPVFVRDWRAEALYGSKQAMIAAERLVDGEFVRVEIRAAAHVVELQFDREEIFYADGVELASTPAEAPVRA